MVATPTYLHYAATRSVPPDYKLFYLLEPYTKIHLDEELEHYYQALEPRLPNYIVKTVTVIVSS